jgi:Bacterial HORMA domain family 1
MASTGTRTGTHTSTLPKVVYVTKKVRVDLLEIIDTYDYFSEDHARKIIDDVRVLLDEEVVDRIKFTWLAPGSSTVLEELEYVVIAGGIGLADDRAGDIRYRSQLSTADFNVRVTYNTRWRDMAETQRAAVRSDLTLTWGPAGEVSYAGGQWDSAGSYAQGDYGVHRRRFTRS